VGWTTQEDTTRPTLGPTQPSVQQLPGSFAVLMRPKLDVDFSLVSSAKVKNEWSYTSAPSMCLHGLGKDKSTNLVILHVNYIVYVS
jgi:hypothetical protein